MWKKKIDKLVEECSENIDRNEMLYNETLDIISSNNNKTFDSCIVYIVLFIIFLITNNCICCIFNYFHWYLKK